MTTGKIVFLKEKDLKQGRNEYLLNLHGEYISVCYIIF